MTLIRSRVLDVACYIILPYIHVLIFLYIFGNTKEITNIFFSVKYVLVIRFLNFITFFIYFRNLANLLCAAGKKFGNVDQDKVREVLGVTKEGTICCCPYC